MQKVASDGDDSPTRRLPAGEAVSFRRGSSAAAVLIKPRRIEARDKRGPEWMNALYVMRKHWKLSAAFALVLMLTVIVVVFSIKPVYEPVARIEVDPPGEQFSLEGGTAGSDVEYLETQAQNLKSDKLAIDVIHRLHLDQSQELLSAASSKHQP